jgi:uncharacterized protein YceH (UPF0502 family)
VTHLDAVQVRVLGALIEKQRTTPDVYPLSLNALRLACNQSTSRDPVVDYDEPTIREALDGLGLLRYTRVASGPGSRTAKFRHLLDETLTLDAGEISLLAVLLLRGHQTAAELRGRSERLHAFASLAAVESVLEGLAGRRLVLLLERRPGQKEARYAHLLAGTPVEDESAPTVPGPAPGGLAARVEALAAEVAELRTVVEELIAQRG